MKHMHRYVYVIFMSMAHGLIEAFLVFTPSCLLSMSDFISLPLVHQFPLISLSELVISPPLLATLLPFVQPPTTEPIDSFFLTSSQFICLSVHRIIYPFTFLFLSRGIPIYFHYIHDITKTGFLCHLLKHLERVKSNIRGCRKGLNFFSSSNVSISQIFHRL